MVLTMEENKNKNFKKIILGVIIILIIAVFVIGFVVAYNNIQKADEQSNLEAANVTTNSNLNVVSNNGAINNSNTKKEEMIINES